MKTPLKRTFIPVLPVAFAVLLGGSFPVSAQAPLPDSPAIEAQAHAMIAKLTPCGGSGHYSDKGEQIREAVNDWIRNSGTFDGVADFDKATQNPANPTQFNPAYDSGDHLHPKDAGYKAIADSIDLALFAK